MIEVGMVESVRKRRVFSSDVVWDRRS